MVPPTLSAVNTVIGRIKCHALSRRICKCAFGGKTLVAVTRPCKGTIPSFIENTFISNADKKKDGKAVPAMANTDTV